MAGLSEEEKEELTEEERKAVEEGGDESEEAGEDATGDPVDEGTDAATETDQVVDPGTDQKTDQKTDQQAAPPEGQQVQAPPPPPVAPLIKPVPAEEIKRLEDSLADAKKKFDDGDISYEELSAAQRELDKAQIKNEIATESNKEASQATWRYEQQRFWQNNPTWAQSTALSSAMMTMVNKMIEGNEGAGMTDEQFLQEAQGRVIADFEAAGFQVAGAKKATKTPAELVKEAKAKGADRSHIPQDLRDIPAADAPGDQDEFAWLDKLSGEQFERAVSKLTPEQLERYENVQ